MARRRKKPYLIEPGAVYCVRWGSLYKDIEILEATARKVKWMFRGINRAWLEKLKKKYGPTKYYKVSCTMLHGPGAQVYIQSKKLFAEWLWRKSARVVDKPKRKKEIKNATKKRKQKAVQIRLPHVQQPS